jgi:hypothetical protein
MTNKIKTTREFLDVNDQVLTDKEKEYWRSIADEEWIPLKEAQKDKQELKDDINKILDNWNSNFVDVSLGRLREAVK